MLIDHRLDNTTILKCSIKWGWLRDAFSLSSLHRVIEVPLLRGRSVEPKGPFPFKCNVCYKSEIWYKTSVSDFWTRVQTPSLWLSSVDNLRASHLSSPSFYFLKLSQRDTPLLWDNLCRRWPINLVPCSSLQYLEAQVLFLVKKGHSTPAILHLWSWPSDMNPQDVLTRDGKLKEEYKEMSKSRRPLCLCTPPGVLMLLSLNCGYNSTKQESFMFCMRKPRLSETDLPCEWTGTQSQASWRKVSFLLFILLGCWRSIWD